MSSMLDQAIVDAKQLKEAAIKNAESTIIEKYSQEIREAVDTMLSQEQEEVLSEEDSMVTSMPMAASDVTSPHAPPDGEVVELDFAELEQMIDQELGEEEAEEMTDRHDFAEDEIEDEEASELQESGEIDLNNLFEDEEINLDEEAIEELAEKLTLDFQPVKSGNLGMPDSQKQEAYEEAKALNAHIDEEEEASDEIQKEIGKLRESVETLEAEKKELQEKLQTLQSNTKHIEDVVLKLKNALNETSVQNAKLLYTNEALTCNWIRGCQ